MAKSAADAVANYQKGMAGAGDAYKKGVQAVQQAPTALAATQDAMNRYAANCAESVTSGRRQAALQAVSLSDWQQAAINKGAARLQSGASAAMNRVQAHFAKWMPTYQQASDAARQVSKDDPIGRVRASINIMRAAAGRSTF